MFVISPSQIDNFLRCKRKWEYEKISSVPTIDRPWFQFGHEIHKALEDHTRGKPQEQELQGQQRIIFEAALESGLLPPQGTPVEVTRAGILTRYVMLQARADWVWEHPNGYTLLGDYKTTSDEKSEWYYSTLQENTQAITNAWLLYRSGAKEVRARWIYCHKKRKKRKVVWMHEAADELLTRETVDQYMGDVVIPVAESITAHRFSAARGRRVRLPMSLRVCEDWTNTISCDYCERCFNDHLRNP